STVRPGTNGNGDGSRRENGLMASQKAGIVQPMQPTPALTGQLMPPSKPTLAQLAKVSGPLQPSLYRHQPFWAPSSPHAWTNSPNSKWARRSHSLWTIVAARLAGLTGQPGRLMSRGGEMAWPTPDAPVEPPEAAPRPPSTAHE